ncbi:hypothetical protein BBJ28_00021341 [Nothophytophthora sp. Chile5]|nr:hypothetical protein BBJ28_00021341 [Nothophytophthora sp. Chile5]
MPRLASSPGRAAFAPEQENQRKESPQQQEEQPVLTRSVPATKRRASSLSDLFQRRNDTPSSAKSAMVSAFHTVSSRTTQRLAKLRSSSDNFLKRTREKTPTGPWKLMSRGSKPGRLSSATFRWNLDTKLQHANATFAFHGEDAGAHSSYFHIVADGVSSPFGRQSLASRDAAPVSSAVIAQEVVRCVQITLEEMTDENRQPLDQTTFESAIVDAVKTARINCFQHRKSRLATTLSVSYFNRWTGRLLTFSLGDSKCLVVRRGVVVYETLAVLREFNVPTVVNLREQIVHKDYVVQSFLLHEGDVCLTFSDGLGDNLYKNDLTAALAAPELWDSAGNDADSGLQSVCDELVTMSKVQEKAKPHAKAPVGEADRLLFPFATAAALEYRARALETAQIGAAEAQDASGVDHLAVSLELMRRHEGKETLDRHLLLRKPSRKRHYSLHQLKLMAEMQTKKPDDITLFMTRFVGN